MLIDKLVILNRPHSFAITKAHVTARVQASAQNHLTYAALLALLMQEHTGLASQQYGTVLIKKCRYLESSGCVGACVNLCKVTWTGLSVGMLATITADVAMPPNFCMHPGYRQAVLIAAWPYGCGPSSLAEMFVALLRAYKVCAQVSREAHIPKCCGFQAELAVNHAAYRYPHRTSSPMTLACQ